MVNKVAVKSTAEIIYEGSDELLKENDYIFFKESAPANLKFIEGLWANDRSNKKLLTLLVKGYAAYTFAVLETEAYEDILNDEQSDKTLRVILNYEKAIKYGYLFLNEIGISKTQFDDKGFPAMLNEVLESQTSSDDYIALFYFAQALGSSMNLQRTNVSKMGKLTHIKVLLDWICAKKPDLENGMCTLFSAVIEASTPLILGGSKDKARKQFALAQKKWPNNLLSRLSYIQFYLLPMLEEEEYQVEMKKLKLLIDKWYNVQLGNDPKDPLNFSGTDQFNLFNALAMRRYNILKKIEKDLF